MACVDAQRDVGLGSGSYPSGNLTSTPQPTLLPSRRLMCVPGRACEKVTQGFVAENGEKEGGERGEKGGGD